MSRLQQILSAVLILQISVVLFVFLPQNTTTSTGEALLPELDTEKVATLEITDNENNSITLASDGDEWMLPDRGEYPVITENVTDVLDKLGAITKDKLVTQTAASHKRLQVDVDDFQRRIILTEDNGSILTVYIGSSAGSQTVHVRLDGEDEVYLARDLSAWNFSAEASSWIDATYLSVASNTVVSASLENDQGTFEFEKTDGQWTMAGLGEEEFNEPNFTALLNRISTLNMKTPLGKEEKEEYGLSDPQAVFTFTVETEDGEQETNTLTIGSDSEDGSSCFVYASNSEYYAAISKTTLEDFINRSQDDFIVQAATPTPEF